MSPKRRMVTQSQQSTVINCEEKARLKYVEMLAPVATGAQSLGSAVHFGFEVGSAEVAVKSLEDSRGELWAEFQEDKLKTDTAIVRGIVSGGLAEWSSWPMRREIQFELPYINPATGHASTKHGFAGMWDGIWLPKELSPEIDEPVLLEIKTTSRLDATYFKRLDLDWQVTAYMYAASQVYGAPVRRMVYRICRKPSIKIWSKVKRPDGVDEKGKAKYLYSPETVEEYAARIQEDYRKRPEFYFAEVVLTRTDEQIERWRWEAWEAHERLLAIHNGAMTIRNPGHCGDYGGCPFIPLCRGDSTPDAYPVRKSLNPELDGTTNE